MVEQIHKIGLLNIDAMAWSRAMVILINKPRTVAELHWKMGRFETTDLTWKQQNQGTKENSLKAYINMCNFHKGKKRIWSRCRTLSIVFQTDSLNAYLVLIHSANIFEHLTCLLGQKIWFCHGLFWELFNETLQIMKCHCHLYTRQPFLKKQSSFL